MFCILFYQLQDEYEKLKKLQKQLQSDIKAYPQINFYCTRNQKRFKWYITTKNGCHYLPKARRDLAEKLACRKYLSMKLKEVESELIAIQSYLSHHNTNYGKADLMLQKGCGYAELLAPYFSINVQDAEQWSSEPYEQNPAHPENLIHPTNLGFSVRSKSEAMIAMILHLNNVPFRYECALTLKGIKIYPDFTILHPTSGQIIYWEHFGLIDNKEYQKAYHTKMRHYISNQIYPSINLITSYETNDMPLAFDKLDRILAAYSLKKMYFPRGDIFYFLSLLFPRDHFLIIQLHSDEPGRYLTLSSPTPRYLFFCRGATLYFLRLRPASFSTWGTSLPFLSLRPAPLSLAGAQSYLFFLCAPLPFTPGRWLLIFFPAPRSP